MQHTPVLVQGYRVDPLTAEKHNVPLLQGLPEDRAERKVAEIRKGGRLAHELPPFPEARACKDGLWALPFVAVVLGVLAAALYFGAELLAEKYERRGVEVPDLVELVVPGCLGGCASLVAAFLYVELARLLPSCVVWTALVFGPAAAFAGGMALVGAGAAVPGLLSMALGAIMLSFVLVCWRPLIPFTIKLVQVVASVIKANPLMVLVALFGSVVGLGWSLVCGVAFVGAFLKFQNELDGSQSGALNLLRFVFALVLIWGSQVVFNVCHVAYCGVFGRWYFKADAGKPLRKSLWVALTTSFGSICLGSLLVAAVRAAEAMVRQARRGQQAEGNALCCIVLLVLESVVSCLGDILEYFSEWAYVQVAVRGAAFMQAARITYSMLTCSSLEYILQDLMVNSVVSLGALLCGAIGCAAGALAGLALGDTSATPAIGGLIGLWAGLLAGGSAAGIISSGTKTILALWAESPEQLRQSHPEVHAELEQRILSRLRA